MSDLAPWPCFDWKRIDRPEQLLERIQTIAILARKLETGLEEAAEAEEIDLSSVGDALALWEQCAADVFMYTGLGEGRPLEAGGTAAHVAQLEKTYASLIELRRGLLAQLPPGASAKVTAREAAAKIDEELLRPPKEPQPALSPPSKVMLDDPSLYAEALGGEEAASDWTEPPKLPVTADEVRARQTAENKPLPKSWDLASLLEHLPSEWVSAVFETLGIEELTAEEASRPSRTAGRRAAIGRFLRDPERLSALVADLGNDERQIVGELLSAEDRALSYAQLTRKHGLDEADGFYWTNRPPSCAIAWLRRTGLAFVGSKDYRLFVVLPSDLAALLPELLAKPCAAE